MSPIVPRILPGTSPADDAATDVRPTDTHKRAFDALVQRHARETALRDDISAAPLLRGLFGDAAQDSAARRSPPAQRDTAAFAHRTPAPAPAPAPASQERSAPPSATFGPVAPPPRKYANQTSLATRRLRQVVGHLDDGGSPHRDAPAQAPAAVQRPTLTQDEVRFAKVAEFVLNRARDFCTNDAVLKSGTWQTQFTIDPEIMPECVLHLSLSGSALALRFDTMDGTSRALISKYAGILKDRLAALMTERGTSPEIEIVS
jgi:hypothetical protein